MQKHINVGALGVLSLGAVVAFWVVFGPGTVPSGTIAWGLGTLTCLAIFVIVFVARAKPARSIAQVLHDVEHPSEKP